MTACLRTASSQSAALKWVLVPQLDVEFLDRQTDRRVSVDPLHLPETMHALPRSP